MSSPSAPDADLGNVEPTRWLRHGRIDLALHQLRAGEGRALLCLHGLGEHSRPDAWVEDGSPPWAGEWNGPIWGLDFTGHGQSTVPSGGGYTAEMLLGDADAALESLGEATIVGRGLGAYVALMAAGARAGRVAGAVLCDGPGLAGGGIQPGTPFVVLPQFGIGRAPDPFAMVELARDVRPPDYAVNFVRLAFESSAVPEPIAVAAVVRPEWLSAVASEPGVVSTSLERALHLYRE